MRAHSLTIHNLHTRKREKNRIKKQNEPNNNAQGICKTAVHFPCEYVNAFAYYFAILWCKYASHDKSTHRIG